MPIRYSDYSKNWKELRAQVLERANHRCEWCKVFNHTAIVRLKLPPKSGRNWRNMTDGEINDFIHMGLHPADGRATTIVLTIAHLDYSAPDGTFYSKHDKKHECIEALAALCQSCHLGYDRDDHVRHARTNRIQKLVKAGQLQLSMED